MLIKPGPAACTSSKAPIPCSLFFRFVANSFGLALRILAAIIQTFVVRCPLFKSSEIVIENFWRIASKFSLLILSTEDKNFFISLSITSIKI